MFKYIKFIAKKYSLIAIFVVSGIGHASATEIVYTPINPSFGGNPNNSAHLLSIAQAQDPFKAPVVSPVEAFNLSLQRSILSRLSSQALTTMFGTSTTLAAGTYDTAGYTIKVVDMGNGTLSLTSTDKASGGVSTFVINSATP